MAFQESLRMELAQYWENSGGQSLDMSSQAGINLVRSATNQVIEDRQLNSNLLTGSDRESIASFVAEVFSGLSKLGLAAGPVHDEPERKRTRKR
ncbi:MAG: hypothetical protein EOP45_11500 [Sphingobacteriaceae bacterium]|nr:MAG: hypothetical protein EOP45_11500 [Sphingobacteriaceae bacterium]